MSGGVSGRTTLWGGDLLRPSSKEMTETQHGETEAEPWLLRGLRYALLLSVVILGVESIGSYLSRSLSLTVDTVHNVPDLFAFAASWAALRRVRGGASRDYTFGSHRLEVFAGLINAGLVLAVGVGFAITALVALLYRIDLAGPVDPIYIFAAAIPTLALRAVNLALLRRVPGRARDLNLNSVLVHLTSDLVITGALLVAGAVLFAVPSATWADPVAAAFIAVVLIWESIPLFRVGVEVLTERIPANLSLAEIEATARSVPSVTDVHDIHVWSVCPTLVCMSAHVRVPEMSVRDSMSIIAQLRRSMEERFGIVHSVFEVEVGNPV